MDTLLSETVIAKRVAELGHKITDAYRGRPLTVLGVLNGSVVLVADLIRAIDIPHHNRSGRVDDQYRFDASHRGSRRSSRRRYF
jgi:hypoxanthine-guanine phosphoribosyltransferase